MSKSCRVTRRTSRKRTAGARRKHRIGTGSADAPARPGDGGNATGLWLTVAIFIVAVSFPISCLAPANAEKNADSAQKTESDNKPTVAKPKPEPKPAAKQAAKPAADKPQAANNQKAQDAKPAAKAANNANQNKPAKAAADNTNQAKAAAPAQIAPKDAAAMTQTAAAKPKSTAIMDLPKLSRTEIDELSDRLALYLQATHGYNPASSAVGDALPSPPAGIVGGRTLSKSGPGGMYVLRYGYRYFISQPPQFWSLGVIVDDSGDLTANPDLGAIEPEVTKMVTALNKIREALTVQDLDAKIVQLSYTDADSALGMLKGFGITTMAKVTEIPAKIDYSKLPYVIKVDDPAKEYTGLIGGKTEVGGGKLSLSPGIASEMTDNAIASPMTQLLVMFHPAHPEQFSRVRHVLDTYVDRAARQIFIEAMVLEISEEGLEELGVEWELNETPLDITGGATKAGPATTTNTLDINISDLSLLHNLFDGNFDWDKWEITIKALVREGKAEILSRPSVLTLNNRQSTIRVGRDIPVASSLEGGYSGNRVSFKFDYLPTGILLNIRPRINETGSEVTMLVDTVVSARVPGGDLQLTDRDGVVLASAPTVSTRRVQTYGRIGNNTPFIIGGLVARELVVTQDKVPLLGDLPIVGIAFRAETKETLKREVIIVLTPHVLPEQREVRRAFPKDEDHFDSFDHELFRDSYRIRSEDVFDLTFLLENQRISRYRQMAREVAEKNFRLGASNPFRAFVRDSVPGESILVTRMIYEVIKRLDIAATIHEEKIIYFDSQQVGGYNVRFLEELINDPEGKGMKDFDGKALAITYNFDRDSLEEGRLGSEPIPEIKLVECPDREAWGVKLWELNRPAPDGRKRHTILLQDESDVLRLRRALALKKIAVLNGGVEHMRLRNFSVGKTLLMPELKDEQIHVVDADTAMFFFHTEHYYAATLERIETQLQKLDRMLRRPEIKALLDSDLEDISPDIRED